MNLKFYHAICVSSMYPWITRSLGHFLRRSNNVLLTLPVHSFQAITTSMLPYCDVLIIIHEVRFLALNGSIHCDSTSSSHVGRSWPLCTTFIHCFILLVRHDHTHWRRSVWRCELIISKRWNSPLHCFQTRYRIWFNGINTDQYG